MAPRVALCQLVRNSAVESFVQRQPRVAATSTVVAAVSADGRKDEQRFLVRRGELQKACDAPAEQRLDHFCRHVADLKPHDMGRRSEEQGKLTEIAVLRHDDVAPLPRVFPDLSIRGSVETDFRNMHALGVVIR